MWLRTQLYFICSRLSELRRWLQSFVHIESQMLVTKAFVSGAYTTHVNLKNKIRRVELI